MINGELNFVFIRSILYPYYRMRALSLVLYLSSCGAIHSLKRTLRRPKSIPVRSFSSVLNEGTMAALDELVWTKLLGKEAKAQLDPHMTLIMGQCFNWNKLDVPEEADTWVAIVEGKALAIKSESDCMYYADLVHPGVNHDAYLRQYFQLDHNLEELYDLWGQGCPRMKTVTSALPGVRVLRQDPWECLISFICSSNNNIKRITLMLDRLKRTYGTYVCSVVPDGDSYKVVKVAKPPVIEVGESGIDASLFVASPQKTPLRSSKLAEAETSLEEASLTPRGGGGGADRNAIHLFDFPSVQDLAAASEADLRALGMGYRAKFLKGSAEKVLELGGPSWLQGLRVDSRRSAETVQDEEEEEDRSKKKGKKGKKKESVSLSHRLWVNEQLQLLPGVGRKVADCVAVFSLDQSESIPVDVHVWDIAVRDYAPDLQKALSLTPVIYEQVGDLFRDRFMRHAGWAHSVLFAAELPAFKRRLPVAMQEEMDSFDLLQRQLKTVKRESAKKRRLEKETRAIATGKGDVYEVEVTGDEEAGED